MDVTLFLPCFIDQIRPELGWKFIHLLEKIGYCVQYHPSQTCCGYPPYSIGKKEISKLIVEKFILENIQDTNPILIPAGTCVSMVTNHYQNLFADSSLHLKMRSIQNRTQEYFGFICTLLLENNDWLPVNNLGKVALLNSCYSVRDCGVKTEVNNILKLLPNLEIIDYPLANDCCGYGYNFAHDFDILSQQIGKNKIESIAQSGAKTVIVNDLMCLIQTESIIKQLNLNLKAVHLIDVLMPD